MLGKTFQKLKQGDRVVLNREKSAKSNFPKRMQGRAGTIIGKRGKAYIVSVRDNKKEKTYIVKAINLKKLK